MIFFFVLLFCKALGAVGWWAPQQEECWVSWFITALLGSSRKQHLERMQTREGISRELWRGQFPGSVFLSTQSPPVVLSSPVLGAPELGKTMKIMNAIVARRVTGCRARKTVFQMSPGSTCTSGIGLATIKSWKSPLRPHESFSANESTLWFCYQINMCYLLSALVDVTARLKPISRASACICR